MITTRFVSHVNMTNDHNKALCLTSCNRLKRGGGEKKKTEKQGATGARVNSHSFEFLPRPNILHFFLTLSEKGEEKWEGREK